MDRCRILSRLQTTGPVGKARHMDATLPDINLLATKRQWLIEVGELEVVRIGAPSPRALRAIVRREEDQRVFAKTGVVKRLHNAADGVVEMIDRREEQTLFGIVLALDFSLGVVKPPDLRLVEPAGGVVW